jgi:hypothetical protein
MGLRSLGAIVVLLASASVAQGQLRPRGQRQRPTASRQQQPVTQQDRQQLQRRVQQRLWQMTQRRVGLSDAQMDRLAPIHQRFESQRRTITREERQTRLALRDALRDSTHADQKQVSGYLDRLVQLQHQRSDLVDQEQKELAQFMTPVQRARYTALQEQVRRRVEQLVRQRQGVAGDSGAAGVPRP